LRANARLLWTPYPYRAGFCITDDPDGADLDEVRVVYDFLRGVGIKTTKAVWVLPAAEPCGDPPLPFDTSRELTFENEEYRDYCLGLHRDGYEICLHGASAGNNRREATIRAFELLEREIAPSGTFICHSKNAENIYWEDKVTSLPIVRRLLTLYSEHRCRGEVEDSSYFWGDICRERVRQMRLFRTRRLNTLAVNPSMPYYDPDKPYVRGWFTASKRSFRDATTSEALERLKRENGLTILYQYLHRYTRRTQGRVEETVTAGARRLAEDPEILVDTISRIMERLRDIQGLFIIYRDNQFWIVNVHEREATDVQIELSRGIALLDAETGVEQPSGNILHIPILPPQSCTRFQVDQPVRFTARRTGRLDRHRHTALDFGAGILYVNLSDTEWFAREGRSVPPGDYQLHLRPEFSAVPALSGTSRREERRLVRHQLLLIVREVLFAGRRLRANKFLTTRGIVLDDHENW
jgi:hypothetical protein